MSQVATEFRGKVTQNQALTSGVFQVSFQPEQPFSFDGGQWLSLVIPSHEKGGKDLRRPYSIASPPESNEIELCVQLIPDGPGTTYLRTLKPGDSIQGSGPFGHLTYRSGPLREACFIATGTGIAPFRSMILSNQFRDRTPRRTQILLGIRHEEDALYRSELEASQKTTWTSCISQPRQALGAGDFAGRVTAYLVEAELAWLETDFYLCGNGAMIKEAKALLLDRGVPKSSIFQEKYF